MGRGRQKKYDTLTTGAALGFLLPLAVLLLFYLVRYAQIPLSDFISDLWKMKILVKLLSLCGFVNLMAFLWLYRKKMDKAARGVIAATIFYALLVLLSAMI